MSDMPQEVAPMFTGPRPSHGVVARHRATLAACIGACVAAGWGCAAPTPRSQLAYFPAPPATPRVVHLLSFDEPGELCPPRGGLASLWGTAAPQPVLGTPAGIAYSDGRLFICDSSGSVVHVWDLERDRQFRIGDRGEAALSTPVAVAVAPDGTVIVADTGRGELLAYLPDRTLRYRVKPPGREKYRPVAVAAHGGEFYAADISAHQIDVFSVCDGKYLRSMGTPGNGTGQLYFPMGVSVDDAGRVWVSDMLNGRVQVFEANGQPGLSFGQPGDRYGDFGKPRHLAASPDGIVAIADAEFSRVHLYNASGQLLLLLGRSDDCDGALPLPVGVAFAETLPEFLSGKVPAGYRANGYLLVSNTVGARRLSLFAIVTGE